MKQNTSEKNSLFALLTFSWMAVAGVFGMELKEVAGKYYFGDGMGSNNALKIDDDGSFNYGLSGCLGTYATSQGKVTLQEGVLHFDPEEKAKEKSHLELEGYEDVIPTVLRVVYWGKRTYLIPPQKMIAFCSSSNQGREPRDGAHGEFYLREDDEHLKVDGKPTVPEGYRKYLLDSPVHSEVIELVSDQEAWINKGSAEGLLIGMELIAFEHPLRFPVVVIEVEQERSRVQCVWKDSKFREGQLVSSRFAGKR